MLILPISQMKEWGLGEVKHISNIMQPARGRAGILSQVHLNLNLCSIHTWCCPWTSSIRQALLLESVQMVGPRSCSTLAPGVGLPRGPPPHSRSKESDKAQHLTLS